MGHRSVAVEIAAEPRLVYALYTDGARLGEWSGARKVESSGPLDRVGSRFSASYGGPFTVRGEVVAVEPAVSHTMRLSELGGLVTCLTSARFEPAGAGTRLSLSFDYRAKGGPLAGLLDAVAGGEMVGTFTKDAARLKVIAEREAR
jgi:uncharacterized protein YndB with AHSA1/START domain